MVHLLIFTKPQLSAALKYLKAYSLAYQIWLTQNKRPSKEQQYSDVLAILSLFVIVSIWLLLDGEGFIFVQKILFISY